MSSEWEYKDFNWTWPDGYYRAINAFWPEARYRQELWSHKQATFLPILRGEMDNGWEAISEIGPSAIQFRYFDMTESNVDFGRIVIWVISMGIFFILDILLGNLTNTYHCASPTKVQIKLRRKL